MTSAQGFHNPESNAAQTGQMGNLPVTATLQLIVHDWFLAVIKLWQLQK
jgi:hypothetical protein